MGAEHAAKRVRWWWKNGNTTRSTWAFDVVGARVVEPDAWQGAALHDAVEELAARFGVEEPAGGVAEHPVGGPARPPRDGRAAKGGALRVLFSFEPRRRAILLLGGDKSGEWNDWYGWAVPLANDLCDEHLRELGEEGLI